MAFSHIPVLTLERHISVGKNLKITVFTSAEELLRLRPRWESLYANGGCTIFQGFWLNVLAAERFSDREQPYVVCAETSNGIAIVPTALRHSDNSIRLLGEELFDYRSFLHGGDDQAVRAALAALASLGCPLEIVAMREADRSSVSQTVIDELHVLPFAAAPVVRCAETSAEQFATAHGRLARNLRRLERLGLERRSYNGDNPQLLRSIYAGKAAQHSSSLFHDPARIEFLIGAAALMPERFEIFTLEKEFRAHCRGSDPS